MSGSNTWRTLPPLPVMESWTRSSRGRTSAQVRPTVSETRSLPDEAHQGQMLRLLLLRIGPLPAYSRTTRLQRRLDHGRLLSQPVPRRCRGLVAAIAGPRRRQHSAARKPLPKRRKCGDLQSYQIVRSKRTRMVDDRIG